MILSFKQKLNLSKPSIIEEGRRQKAEGRRKEIEEGRRQKERKGLEGRKFF
ncbi:MAG: hypothetical protein F6K54_32410 [Okeania sp. SIO3B5]|uniref:hypothetical protein n=1 Tax=Okeania sp. SIO3B5 TaxID=2607811 RepID=UPI0014005749|nr:hypothetical protein [Okeania sp. SIO3B5]NEO57367.1 hypothetical protein [Okeania sp. SIO3B5]